MTAKDASTRAPRERTFTINGIDLVCFDRPGDGPPVLLAHATSFHARCWDRVIKLLPGRHCIAVDLRGHGRSAKPPPPYPWSLMGDDLAGLARALDLHGALGVGHSSGAYAITVAAARASSAFAGLLLVDPTIGPRESYHAAPRPLQLDFVLRRRNQWASPDEMFERFKDRHPYSLWQPAVLRDYCDYGLMPSPSGEGYVLACPPDVEAAVYAGSRADDIYPIIEALDLPVRVLRARPRPPGPADGPLDMSSSPTAPDLAAHFPRGEDVSLPELSHFIPMQAPELVARQIEEMLGKLDAGL